MFNWFNKKIEKIETASLEVKRDLHIPNVQKMEIKKVCVESTHNSEENFDVASSFTLASLLATIATILISVLTSSSSKYEVLLYGLLAFISVTSSALIVDSTMDKILEIDYWKRCRFQGRGYLLFTLALSFVALAIHFSISIRLNINELHHYLIVAVIFLSLFSSIAIYMKAMCLDEYYLGRLILLFNSLLFSIYLYSLF